MPPIAGLTDTAPMHSAHRRVISAILPSRVAALAALGLLAGCGGGMSHNHKGAVASPPVAGAQEILVEARSFSFTPNEIHLKPGESVNITLAPVDILHDFTVVGLSTHVVAKAGETGSGGLTAPAQPGRYAFICTVPGHSDGGMKGTLVVDPA